MRTTRTRIVKLLSAFILISAVTQAALAGLFALMWLMFCLIFLAYTVAVPDEDEVIEV